MLEDKPVTSFMRYFVVVMFILLCGAAGGKYIATSAPTPETGTCLT